MDSNNPESGPKDPSRRQFLKVGAEVAVLAGLGSAGLTGAEVVGGPKPSDLLLSNKEISPREELFKKVFGMIDKAPSEEKVDLIRIASRLKKITDVNEAFVNAYNTDIDESGEPRLLTLYRKKFANFGIENPEDMIFIKDLDKRSQTFILNPLGQAVNSEGDIGGLLREIDTSLKKDVSGVGENRLVGYGEWVRLIDYEFVDTEKGGSLNTTPGAGEITSPVGKRLFEEDKKRVEELSSMYSAVGKTEVKLWSSHYENDNDDREMGKQVFEGAGNFHELEDRSIINLTVGDKGVSVIDFDHERFGHQEDIVLNDTHLFRYLSPEKIYKLYVLREEALSHKRWGRTHTSIDDIFAKRSANVSAFFFEADKRKFPAPGETTPHEVGFDLEEARKDLDDYPDGVFLTGIYAGTNDGWKLRNEDNDVVREYSAMIASSGGESRSFSEFLKNHAELIQVIAQKNEWMGAIFDKLSEMLPVIDGKTQWLPRQWSDSGHSISEKWQQDRDNHLNSEWFNFCVTIGQRMAVIEMIKDKDTRLETLSEEDRDIFKARVLQMFRAADQEVFANMVSLSVGAKRLGMLKEESPYIKYLDELHS